MKSQKKTGEGFLSSALSRRDREAFSGVFRMHGVKIYRFCRGMLGDADLAKDALQDTFLALFQSPPAFSHDGELLGWLFRVARNNALMQVRHERRFAETDLEELPETMTPALVLEEEERRLLVERALQATSPEHREVLILREFEGLSYRAIAEITGSTEANVKSRLFRGRREFAVQVKWLFEERRNV
jgi:RNA polymerase sigma-70 factor (ECF subfamily)